MRSGASDVTWLNPRDVESIHLWALSYRRVSGASSTSPRRCDPLNAMTSPRCSVVDTERKARVVP